MIILLCAATELELNPLLNRLAPYKKGALLPSYDHLGNEIKICETGVGMLHTSYALKEAITLHKPDLILNIGIAGSYHGTDDIGKCYQVVSEVQGDLGVESEGELKTIFDLKLRDQNLYPYQRGKMILPQDYQTNLSLASGLTVNRISSSHKLAMKYADTFKVDLESMEGAAVAYICMMSRIPVIMLKSISNVAGERDKSKWNIELAITNLANESFKVLSTLERKSTRLL